MKGENGKGGRNKEKKRNLQDRETKSVRLIARTNEGTSRELNKIAKAAAALGYGVYGKLSLFSPKLALS